jgi:S1-C subfamily serine protease
VVNQDVKSSEAIARAEESLVGLFAKKKTDANSTFSLEEYYNLDANVASGLIISSDGWILAKVNGLSKLVDNYVALDYLGQIYEIDKVLPDIWNDFSFIHLAKATNLAVKPLASWSDIDLGQNLVLVDWKEGAVLSSVVNKENNFDLVRSSDVLDRKIIINNETDLDFAFNLNGQVVGLLAETGVIKPISDLRAEVSSLLANGQVLLPYFGVSYLDLSNFVKEGERNNKGALIFALKGETAVLSSSPAATLGLQAGDIISSINNIEINKYNDLADVILGFKVGDKLDVYYKRDGKDIFGQLRLEAPETK